MERNYFLIIEGSEYKSVNEFLDSIAKQRSDVISINYNNKLQQNLLSAKSLIITYINMINKMKENFSFGTDKVLIK
jgi:hypothetical protein